MDSLDTWLAAMPVQDVDRRIRELERELEVLRVLKRRHDEREQVTAPLRRMQEAGIDPLGAIRPKKRARRLSPERAAILRLIRDNPTGMSPAEVTAGLQQQGVDADQNAIQTTMSRMARDEQLLRVEHGRYKLPPHIPVASLLNGAAGGEEG
jgi:hypothetical protein